MGAPEKIIAKIRLYPIPPAFFLKNRDRIVSASLGKCCSDVICQRKARQLLVLAQGFGHGRISRLPGDSAEGEAEPFGFHERDKPSFLKPAVHSKPDSRFRSNESRNPNCGKRGVCRLHRRRTALIGRAAKSEDWPKYEWQKNHSHGEAATFAKHFRDIEIQNDQDDDIEERN